MNDEYRKLLIRQALSQPRTGGALMVKIRAICELERRLVPVDVDRIRMELLSIINNGFNSWEASRAASMAARVLAIMDGQLGDFPSETPDEQAPKGYWPYDTPDGEPARHGQDAWEELDSGDSQGLRDHWREQLVGKPPWDGDESSPDDAA